MFLVSLFFTIVIFEILSWATLGMELFMFLKSRVDSVLSSYIFMGLDWMAFLMVVCGLIIFGIIYTKLDEYLEIKGLTVILRSSKPAFSSFENYQKCLLKR